MERHKITMSHRYEASCATPSSSQTAPYLGPCCCNCHKSLIPALHPIKQIQYPAEGRQQQQDEPCTKNGRLYQLQHAAQLAGSSASGLRLEAQHQHAQPTTAACHKASTRELVMGVAGWLQLAVQHQQVRWAALSPPLSSPAPPLSQNRTTCAWSSSMTWQLCSSNGKF